MQNNVCEEKYVLHVFPVFNTIPCKGKIFHNKFMEWLNYLMYLEELLNPDLSLVLANMLSPSQIKEKVLIQTPVVVPETIPVPYLMYFLAWQRSAFLVKLLQK